MPLDERLRKTVAAALGVADAEISTSSSRDTLDQWDSAGIINLMLALEEEYGVRFEPDEAETLLTMDLVVAALRDKGASV